MHPIPYDLSRLNTATKYPSIPTHHQLDPRNGGLLETPTVFTGDVVLTEKVDGTNGRVVLLDDDDFFIGSREELLYAKGDRIANPAQGIVTALEPLAQRLSSGARFTGAGITVLYLEVYGGKIGSAAKQYQDSGAVGYRLFDIAQVPFSVLDWAPSQISTWRENAGPKWYSETDLLELSATEDIAVTPRLGTLPASALPSSIEDVRRWMEEVLPATRVALDQGAKGNPEGIVLRDTTRTAISKARFQDYDRTLQRRTAAQR
ncbi:RNA ligase family protein [Kitasatospora sp. NPDC056783]|uniref:RNA ligase family protein n=1 Tax=Kitasatospora sp. NPDC056783 TaxID=3345943 RepID=UPI0036CFB5A4